MEPFIKEVAIFGGSFNPPHVAHMFAACYLSSGRFDSVLIVPVYKHVFGKDLASFDHRLEMCRMTFGWIPKVEISTIERDLESSISANTIRYLKNNNPNWNLHLVIGADTAQDLKDGKWKDSDKLLEITKPYILGRSGHKYNDLSILPDISSTEVRASLKDQIDPNIAKTFLISNVYDYIKTNNLYQKLEYPQYAKTIKE